MISNYPEYFRTMPMTPEFTPEMCDEISEDDFIQDTLRDDNPRQTTPTPALTPAPTTFEMAPGAPVTQDTDFVQGYLRTQIGKRVRATFLLGTGTLQDRTGILESVGISYIILRNEETNTKEMADIYSIKFVVIFDNP
ncbi:hypothetical protein [Clostridium kluyveri]|uniref:Uncharacterized protein n=1 Tax=Clostridium kluyveri TaxID=1534 RepID=A0A1L5FBF4_CLOKL|nr:hypothetical protein [Clostridium kluyveri]APM40348.1 hypothetical protein BS101_17210 [Clostridium kluyveri]